MSITALIETFNKISDELVITLLKSFNQIYDNNDSDYDHIYICCDKIYTNIKIKHFIIVMHPSKSLLTNHSPFAFHDNFQQTKVQ